MTLPEIVPSLETCKKLAELRKRETYFCWFKKGNTEYVLVTFRTHLDIKNITYAPTVSELAEELIELTNKNHPRNPIWFPDYLNFNPNNKYNNGKLPGYYRGGTTDDRDFLTDNMAEAYARKVIIILNYFEPQPHDKEV